MKKNIETDFGISVRFFDGSQWPWCQSIYLCRSHQSVAKLSVRFSQNLVKAIVGYWWTGGGGTPPPVLLTSAKKSIWGA